MKIIVSFEIDCSAVVAWRAMHRTKTIANVYAPLLRMQSDGQLPDEILSGAQIEVRLRAFNLVDVGRQLIAIRDAVESSRGSLALKTGEAQVHTMHDQGGPLTGPLKLARTWHHQMSVSALPGDRERAIWTDSLSCTGPFVWLLWPALWCSWRLRARRIKSLARGW